MNAWATAALGLWAHLPAAHGWRAASAACVRAGGLPPGPRLAPARPPGGPTGALPTGARVSLRAWSSALRPTTPDWGQQAGAGLGHGHGLQGTQGNLVDGRASGVRRQVLSQQAAQVGQRLRGWAVRTAAPARGHITPSTLRRSWCQASSSASTPCWRACNQACSACSKAWADHSSASAEVASAGSSAASANFGQFQPGVRVGASPKGTVQRVQAAPQPPRHPIARQGAQLAPGVAAMRARLATWGRSAVRGVQGKSCGTRRGRSPACCSRSSARAWNDVAPWAKGAGGGCTRGDETPTRPLVQVGRNAGFIAGALACAGPAARAAAPQALSRGNLQQQRAHPPAPPWGKAQRPPSPAPCTVCHVGAAPGTPPGRCVRVQAGLGTRIPQGRGRWAGGVQRVAGTARRSSACVTPFHPPAGSANHPALCPPASRTWQWPAKRHAAGAAERVMAAQALRAQHAPDLAAAGCAGCPAASTCASRAEPAGNTKGWASGGPFALEHLHLHGQGWVTSSCTHSRSGAGDACWRTRRGETPTATAPFAQPPGGRRRN